MVLAKQAMSHLRQLAGVAEVAVVMASSLPAVALLTGMYLSKPTHLAPNLSI